MYINAIEIHGNFNPVTEVSTNSYSSVSEIEKLQDDENYTAAAITINSKKLLIIQANKNVGVTTKHTIQFAGKAIEWSGPYQILYDGKELK